MWKWCIRFRNSRKLEKIKEIKKYCRKKAQNVE
jgi:hypothetical protein